MCWMPLVRGLWVEKFPAGGPIGTSMALAQDWARRVRTGHGPWFTAWRVAAVPNMRALAPRLGGRPGPPQSGWPAREGRGQGACGTAGQTHSGTARAAFAGTRRPRGLQLRIAPE